MSENSPSTPPYAQHLFTGSATVLFEKSRGRIPAHLRSGLIEGDTLKCGPLDPTAALELYPGTNTDVSSHGFCVALYPVPSLFSLLERLRADQGEASGNNSIALAYSLSRFVDCQIQQGFRLELGQLMSPLLQGQDRVELVVLGRLSHLLVLDPGTAESYLKGLDEAASDVTAALRRAERI